MTIAKTIAAAGLLLLGQALIAAEPAPPAEPWLPEFDGYADRPPPAVPPREGHLTFYPCSQCHDHWQPIETPRLLAPVHDVGLQHGEGRLWCLECHSTDERNYLQTVRGGQVGFDESWKICGQCHSSRQKDWYYGAHGKRASGWQGDPERYNCTHCHNPHQPPFVQRAPKPPPSVRAGLEPMDHRPHSRPAVWEHKLAERPGGEPHD